jgi:hypothetical protein
MYEVTARDRQAQTRDLSPSGKSTSPRTWGGRQVSKCSPGERRQCARARAPTANPAAHRWHCVCAGTTASRGRASGFGLAARPGGLPVLPRSLGQDPPPTPDSYTYLQSLSPPTPRTHRAGGAAESSEPRSPHSQLHFRPPRAPSARIRRLAERRTLDGRASGEGRGQKRETEGLSLVKGPRWAQGCVEGVH